WQGPGKPNVPPAGRVGRVRRSGPQSVLLLVLRLPLEVGAVGPLVGLDVLEPSLRVAHSIELLPAGSAVGRTPTLGHWYLRERGIRRHPGYGERGTPVWVQSTPGR